MKFKKGDKKMAPPKDDPKKKKGPKKKITGRTIKGWDDNRWESDGAGTEWK